jgi:hypothetical protein
MNMDDMIFRLTMVYGSNNTNDRVIFYDELQQAKPNTNILWMDGDSIYECEAIHYGQIK